MKRRPVSAGELATRLDSIEPEHAEALVAGAAIPISDYQPSPEMRARAAFEKLNGRPMSDAEWREAEANLDDLMRIAIDWQEHPIP